MKRWYNLSGQTKELFKRFVEATEEANKLQKERFKEEVRLSEENNKTNSELAETTKRYADCLDNLNLNLQNINKNFEIIDCKLNILEEHQRGLQNELLKIKDNIK